VYNGSEYTALNSFIQQIASDLNAQAQQSAVDLKNLNNAVLQALAKGWGTLRLRRYKR
jgi:hypothetical protein